MSDVKRCNQYNAECQNCSGWDALAAELAAVKEIRQHGCECSDDDACQFARDRDKAQADLFLARQENERLRELVRRAVEDGWKNVDAATYLAKHKEGT
jgi:hypothetical protein